MPVCHRNVEIDDDSSLTNRQASDEDHHERFLQTFRMQCPTEPCRHHTEALFDVGRQFGDHSFTGLFPFSNGDFPVLSKDESKHNNRSDTFVTDRLLSH